MNATTYPADLTIGEFIQVNWPNDCFFGMVLDVQQAMIGADGARRVLLELDPKTNRTGWFNINPGEFEVV